MSLLKVPPGSEGWHEDHLIISVLRSGPTPTDIVWETVHSRQTAKMARMGSPPHSKRNFRKRIKSLSNRGIINQIAKELVLTNLGKWVAHSNLLNQDERLGFVDTWLCKTCTNAQQIVVQTPLLQTAKKTSRGIRLDAKCPNCGKVGRYMPTPSSMDIDQFLGFYADAIDDLKQYATVKAVKNQ